MKSWLSTYRGLINDLVLDSMEPAKYLNKWNNILSSTEAGNGFGLVAENESGNMLGYAFGGKNTHDNFEYDGELYAIYLLKDSQGFGIGKSLFLHSIKVFKKNGFQSILLFVLSSNIIARKFYESFGPDFTANETITIDNGQYCDVCYGWSSIEKIRLT